MEKESETETRVILRRIEWSLEWSSQKGGESQVNHKLTIEQPTTRLIDAISCAWANTEGRYLSESDRKIAFRLMEPEGTR